MASSLPQARSEAPWHRFGMGLSALCLVHCLALPWLLASLPVAVLAMLPEALRDNEWLHAALIAPVLLVSGPVLLRGDQGRWQTGQKKVERCACTMRRTALPQRGQGRPARP